MTAGHCTMQLMNTGQQTHGCTSVLRSRFIMSKVQGTRLSSQLCNSFGGCQVNATSTCYVLERRPVKADKAR